ncbi:hypothetical protein [Lysinibacillus capsici]|uniref:hypothetical protein n=1 Tax=Lysinibacillus capsici TaxID=2115968 RepID=UPI003D02D359
MNILRINTERIAVINFDHAIIYFEVEYDYSDSNLDWLNIKIKKCFKELFNYLKKDGIDIEFIEKNPWELA